MTGPRGAGTSRARLVAVVACAALLLAASPALAAPAAPREAGRRSGHDAAEQGAALALLHGAARAGEELTYAGTQTSSTAPPSTALPAAGRAAGGSSSLVDVRHDPAHGATVDADGPVAVTAALDVRQLVLLAAAHELRITGEGRCAGRTARIVTATRRGGGLSGRFWVDRRSGLLLRREVYDDAGGRVRGSAFVALDVAPAVVAPAVTAPAVTAPARPGPGSGLPQASTLAALRRDGWRVPTTLPHRFRLFDTALSSPAPGGDLLHLAYSDGLSTVSLFAQKGGLGTTPLPGWTSVEVGARPVWVRHDRPDRIVWAGGGIVWTLLSDAPPASVREAVAALPRDRAPDTGLQRRLVRGLGRIGAMLTPS